MPISVCFYSSLKKPKMLYCLINFGIKNKKGNAYKNMVLIWTFLAIVMASAVRTRVFISRLVANCVALFTQVWGKFSSTQFSQVPPHFFWPGISFTMEKIWKT
jgi:hypothetical protein